MEGSASRYRRQADTRHVREKPLQLRANLGRELPRRHDDERLGSLPFRLPLNGSRQDEPQRNRLAGAGLGGDLEVSSLELGSQDGPLDRGQLLEAPAFEGRSEKLGNGLEGPLNIELPELGHIGRRRRIRNNARRRHGEFHTGPWAR